MKPEEFGAKLQAQPFSTVREQLMQKVLHVVQGKSQKRTPVRTGTLRRSETTRMESGGARGYVGTNIKYAPFVHDGTKYMAARPFFEWGIEDSRGDVAGLLEKIGNDYFKDIAG